MCVKDIDTNKFYAVINTNELIEVISTECMPLVDYDEDTFECIKSELAAMLNVNPTNEDIWVDKETYVYAKDEDYIIGITDNASNYPRIFIDTTETNSDVVLKSLHSLVSKFGSFLVGLPDTPRYQQDMTSGRVTYLRE